MRGVIFIPVTVFDPPLTCDADLSRPLGGAVQHALLDLLHVGDVRGLYHGKHLLDELEDLGFVPLADLHAVLENHDDVLGPVLRPVFGALLSGSWLGAEHKKHSEQRLSGLCYLLKATCITVRRNCYENTFLLVGNGTET